MTYATQTQIQIAAGGSQRLVDLTDQESSGMVNASVLAEAQGKAVAWIHSHLLMRFAIPVQNLSADGAAIMARLEADETVYQLIYASPSRAIGEFDEAKRKLRLDELQAIARGTMRIDEPSPTPSSAVQANIVTRVGPISRRGLRGIL